jgi:ubiquinone/menaquinone biosynthesis C-methylase UbiE
MDLPPAPESSSSERFERFAQRYVSSATHAQAPELQRLVEIAQPEGHWIVLDIATGGGHTALKFAPYVKLVIATDITPGMLKAARGFIAEIGADNVLFGYADAEQLPFGDSIFDLVTCRVAAHHFRRGDLFVKESGRVLKTGGTLLVEDHVLPEDKNVAGYIERFEMARDPSHNRAFSANEWRLMYQENGLEVSQVELVLKRHMFYEWAERQSPSRQVLEDLVEMVDQAPDEVLAWMQPEDFGSERASFANYHILISGQKKAYV